MHARSLINDFVAAISEIVDIPVLPFDTNEVRTLPAVVVGYESCEKHPVLDNQEIKISIAIYSNGHVTGDPESILSTIFSTLDTDEFNTPVQYAELTDSSTFETESATIHKATLTILI